MICTKKRFKLLLLAAILLGVVLFALIYTRPLTIEARYPVLDLSQCVQIRGYYNDGTSVEDIPFIVDPEDPHFAEAVELFRSPTFKTKLRNLFPSGTKTHRYSEGDFKWSVVFRFEDVLFSTGDTGSGDLLRIENFFGDLELYFDGQTTQCAATDQTEWLRAVMDLIRRASTPA